MRIPLAIARREVLFRRIALAAGVAVLAGCAVQAVLKLGDGDFALHWETGRRFLARENLYAGGHDFPYPPFFAMVFAPVALFPLGLAKVLFFPVGVGVLLLLLRILQGFVRPA